MFFSVACACCCCSPPAACCRRRLHQGKPPPEVARATSSTSCYRTDCSRTAAHGNWKWQTAKVRALACMCCMFPMLAAAAAHGMDDVAGLQFVRQILLTTFVAAGARMTGGGWHEPREKPKSRAARHHRCCSRLQCIASELVEVNLVSIVTS